MLLPVWPLLLLGKNGWYQIIFKRYKFLLLSLILLLLFPQQFCYLLRINTTSHYNILLSSILLLQSFSFFIKIIFPVVLVFGYFSFLRKMCVRFKGLLFLMNLSFRLSLLLLSSWGSMLVSWCICFFIFHCISSRWRLKEVVRPWSMVFGPLWMFILIGWSSK